LEVKLEVIMAQGFESTPDTTKEQLAVRGMDSPVNLEGLQQCLK